MQINRASEILRTWARSDAARGSDLIAPYFLPPGGDRGHPALLSDRFLKGKGQPRMSPAKPVAALAHGTVLMVLLIAIPTSAGAQADAVRGEASIPSAHSTMNVST